MAKKRKRYTAEFKAEAMRLVEHRGQRTMTDVAAGLGVPFVLGRSVVESQGGRTVFWIQACAILSAGSVLIGILPGYVGPLRLVNASGEVVVLFVSSIKAPRSTWRYTPRRRGSVCPRSDPPTHAAGVVGRLEGRDEPFYLHMAKAMAPATRIFTYRCGNKKSVYELHDDCLL